jgi:aldose 1-epimerase
MTCFRSAALVAVLLTVAALRATANTKVTHHDAGKLPDGTPVELYALQDENLTVHVLTYGGEIQSILAPDKNDKCEDVVLGFDEASGYYENNHSKSASFFGPIVGRYANRIAHGKFSLDGREYTLAQNHNGNSLHGGPGGFHSVIWRAKPVANGVELQYRSKDGEEGFPGNLLASVRYTLTGSDLKIEYRATTDKPTVLNLTNHSYFNLSGPPRATILQNRLKINASQFTPVDANMIPTGELKSVAGTPFDFRIPVAVGDRIAADDEQVRIGHGYDHNFVIDGGGHGLVEAAEVYDPASGRVLQVLTTEPGVQLYTSNFLHGTIKGKQGITYGKNSALCLETQHYPDSPNHPGFPSTVLRPDAEFHSVTVYRFSVR